MKILWVTNTALGPLGELIYEARQNGAWMDALLTDFEQAGEHQLVVATTAKVEKPIRVKDEAGTVFYALPNNVPLLYDENRNGNRKAWRKLIEDERPDIIQVWGTEFTHGLCCLREAPDVPAVIYMQGILDAIARHYAAGITYKELKRSVTFRDIIKRDSILQQQEKYRKSSAKEAEMLRRAGNFISENDWCDAHVKAIAPEAVAHRCPLSINKVFGDQNWRIDKAERHSIMCTASGYPLKGLHVMLRGLALLKEKYPDVKLYVPGDPQVSDGSLQWLLRKRGYTKYVEKLIAELGLADQIVWLGNLSQKELAERLSKVSVFVLPSALENHSSSLKEAMMVGVPSVASIVGGVPEYVDHGRNGMLYRFEDYELMAKYVSDIFDDPQLAVRLSEEGKSDMRLRHSSLSLYPIVCDIYKRVINKPRY